MNKKITLYELLGLVKDGQAPKKIKVTGHIYEFDEEYGFYYTKSEKNNLNYALGGLSDEINLVVNAFNKNVEIIEEKKIEKITLLNNGSPNSYAIYDENGTKCALTKHSKVMVDKINEIIDVINKLKEVNNDISL